MAVREIGRPQGNPLALPRSSAPAAVGFLLWDRPGSYAFTVPDGVKSVNAVAIGGGGCGATQGSTSIQNAGASSFGSFVTGGAGGNGYYLGAGAGPGAGGSGTTLSDTVKGGDGGAGALGSSTSRAGGGGAGGWSGNGGSGGSDGQSTQTAGYGGGGGGGGFNTAGGNCGGGGGVGFGIPADGAAGLSGSSATLEQLAGKGGSSGSDGNDLGTNAGRKNGGAYGGGSGSDSGLCGGGGGGGLRYMNNIAVTPGQQITVTVGRGAVFYSTSSYEIILGYSGGGGCVAVSWGDGMEFPPTKNFFGGLFK